MTDVTATYRLQSNKIKDTSNRMKDEKYPYRKIDDRRNCTVPLTEKWDDRQS